MKEYIERDAVHDAVSKLKRLAWQSNTTSPNAESCVAVELDAVHAAVEKIQASDVRPVVRGFWVEENGEDAHTGELWCIWKCSECGARRTAGWRYTQEGRKPRGNFCPNCGADMRDANDGI